jgi:cytochrome c oxidase cbb3-type subunit 3
LRRLTLLLLALSFVTLAQPQPPRPDPAAIARGKSAFQSSCGFCHGEDATGNRAPDLIRSVSLGHDANGDTVGPIIRNGRPDKGMPGFPSLSNAQLADIVAFLHNQADAALHSNAVPKDYSVAKLNTGNAAAGKTYFAAACASCHSPSGDLKGVASKYQPLELELKFLHPAATQPVIAKVTLANGQVLAGSVAHNDDYDIAIVTPDGWYRSFSKSTAKVVLNDPLAAHKSLLEKLTDADLHNIYSYLVTLK